MGTIPTGFSAMRSLGESVRNTNKDTVQSGTCCSCMLVLVLFRSDHQLLLFRFHVLFHPQPILPTFPVSLRLFKNQFTGSIPTELGQLTELSEWTPIVCVLLGTTEKT